MSFGLFLGLGALAGLVGYGIYVEEKKTKAPPGPPPALPPAMTPVQSAVFAPTAPPLPMSPSAPVPGYSGPVAGAADVIGLTQGQTYSVQAFVDTSNTLSLTSSWTGVSGKALPGTFMIPGMPYPMAPWIFTATWNGPSQSFAVLDPRVAPYTLNGIHVAVAGIQPIPAGAAIPASPPPVVPYATAPAPMVNVTSPGGAS